MRVIVTGASGFVGSALVRRLATDVTLETVAASRRTDVLHPPFIQRVSVPDIADADWNAVVRGATCVVHAAARAHVAWERERNPLAEFRRINVQGTARLARAAVAQGVRRFVFLSSIKVNGEETVPGRPYAADDPPAPEDAYGVSKLEAETILRDLAGSRMEVTIIRPVLVYGPGVRANFLRLMNAVYRRIPLPFASIRNRRSLVALDNLVDLIHLVMRHDAAANEVFLVSDGEDLPTPMLLRKIGAALNRRVLLFPVPAPALRAGAKLLSKPDLARRLCGSLQVNTDKTRTMLGWSPPQRLDDALRDTARDFLARRRR